MTGVKHYVIGRFVLEDGRLSLYALRALAGRPRRRLTCECNWFYRWHSRQAAHKWLMGHPETGDLAVWHLDRFLPAQASPAPLPPAPVEGACPEPVEGVTNGQPATPAGTVDHLSTDADRLINCQPMTVQEAARFLARTPADEEWILKLPLTYRNCVRAAEARLAGSGESGEALAQLNAARALLDEFHAERVRR